MKSNCAVRRHRPWSGWAIACSTTLCIWRALIALPHATVSTCDLLHRAAAGRPRFVQANWVKTGAVVIDAGYNPGNIGDVDFEPVRERASLITPVPGGVGPVTIAVLIDHTADAAARQLGVAWPADEPDRPPNPTQ